MFDGLRTRSANRSAAIGQELADAGSREPTSSLRLGATRAFGEVLLAQANRTAATAALDSAEEDVRRAERRRDAGLATEADVLAVTVHLAQIRERQISAASRETVARLQLNEVMGEPLDAVSNCRLPAAAGAAATPPAPTSKPRRWRTGRTSSGRPPRSASPWSRLRRPSRRFYPQAAVQGVYEFNGGTFTDRASSWTVGAVIRWNLFGGFADSAKLGEAKAAAARARADRQRQESAARVDVRAAARAARGSPRPRRGGAPRGGSGQGESPHRPRPLRCRSRSGQRPASFFDRRARRRVQPDRCRDRCSHQRRDARAGAWKVTPS